MTTSAAALPAIAPAGEAESFATRYGALCALLLLAAAVRLPLAFWPNIVHVDELYQYLEPAWRLLGHQGVVTWEWRDGIRSWFCRPCSQGRSLSETGLRRAGGAPSSCLAWWSGLPRCRSS
jgi:hypothetical protein